MLSIEWTNVPSKYTKHIHQKIYGTPSLGNTYNKHINIKINRSKSIFSGKI